MTLKPSPLHPQHHEKKQKPTLSPNSIALLQLEDVRNLTASTESFILDTTSTSPKSITNSDSIYSSTPPPNNSSSSPTTNNNKTNLINYLQQSNNKW